MNDVFEQIDLLRDDAAAPSVCGLVRSLWIDPESLPAAAQRLLSAGYHLEDISCLDAAETFLVTYHFDHFDRPGRLALRVQAPHEEAHLPSIAAVYQGAEWHERETMDFFGIVFDGNPNPIALLLPPEDDSAPLRKQPAARRPIQDLLGTECFIAADGQSFQESDSSAKKINEGGKAIP